jgi:hypothetical protein
MTHATRTRAGAALACALLLVGTGCPTPETHGTGGGDAGPPAWQAVYEDKGLDGALLSVWGSGPDDVYAVGGPLGNSGFEALVVHYDGKGWSRLAPGGADSFWWVHGSGPSDVWMVGDKGRITHWDGASFRDDPRPTTARIWGVWAASPTDAWAVGGTPEGGTAAPNDIVLHWDGQQWTQEVLPGAPLGRSLNKIWGTSSHDLYAVGELGTIWHRKGTAWTQESAPATGTLLTVFGCSATEVYAVGGNDVLRSDGATWTKAGGVTLTNAVNGVTCGGPGEALIVGFGGLKQRLVDGAWVDDFLSAPHGDLHGSWSDGHGAFWAAGGDFITSAKPGVARKASLGRFGTGTVAGIVP